MRAPAMVAPVMYGSNEGCGTTTSSPGSKAASATSVISSSAPFPTTICAGATRRSAASRSRSAVLPPSG
jgi:hypothetical protein